MSDSLDHANPIDSPTNHTSLIKVVVWILSITSILCVLVRTSVKWTSVKNFNLDDLFITIALLLSIAASVCITLAAQHGYGNHDDSADASNFSLEEKLIIAYNLTFFISHGFSMLSLISLIRNISPAQTHRRIASGIGAGIIVWTIIAVFAFAFQCHPLGQFMGGTCVDRITLYTFIAIFNLVLEVVLILQPVLLTGTLNMTISKKITIMICFLGRILVIVVLIAQVAIIYHHDTSMDILMDIGFILTTLLIPNLSILAASIPYLRPFFIALSWNTWDLDLSYKMQTQTKASSRMSRTILSGGPSAQDMGSNKDWKFERLPASTIAGRLRPDKINHGTTTVTTNSLHENDKIEGGIERTVDFSVEVEHVGHAR